MKEIKVGDLVEWESQSGGYSKLKRGEVMAVVEAGQWAHEIMKSLGLRTNSTAGYGIPRNHKSYIVKIGNKGYWPRVKHLRLIKAEE